MTCPAVSRLSKIENQNLDLILTRCNFLEIGDLPRVSLKKEKIGNRIFILTLGPKSRF